jgi:hypothetical protein
MKTFYALCGGAIALLFAIPASAQVCSVSSFESFEATGRGDTLPTSINVYGEVAGILGLSGPVFERGFVRAANGHITLFDVPRAVQTTVESINARGQITGPYTPSENQGESNGFIRDELGKITPFGVPGYSYTSPRSINGKGEIVGSAGRPAFIRSADGQFTTFTVPGSGTATQVVATSINDESDIAGYVYDSSTQTAHGFARAADGTVTEFDADSAPPVYTTPSGINNIGQISGSYVVSTAQGFVSHGFLRDATGKITTIDPPGSTSTGVGAINNNGFVVGSYTDAGGFFHAFVREPGGGIIVFNMPGAAAVATTKNDKAVATGFGATGINDAGEVIGYYYDSHSREHGFLAKLSCK